MWMVETSDRPRGGAQPRQSAVIEDRGSSGLLMIRLSVRRCKGADSAAHMKVVCTPTPAGGTAVFPFATVEDGYRCDGSSYECSS